MDIFTTLRIQHRELENLFRAVAAATKADWKASAFEDLSDTLVAHVGLEERLLRAGVARAPRSAGLLEPWEARLRVERLITVLAAMNVSSPTFDVELARLRELVEERVAREEGHLFPTLARYLTPPVTAAEPRRAAPDGGPSAGRRPGSARSARAAHPGSSAS
jgi:hypothetical protein